MADTSPPVSFDRNAASASAMMASTLDADETFCTAAPNRRER
jgi:hypothetical protein